MNAFPIMMRLVKSRSGASAAEFGLVLPLLVFLLLGTIDAGRLWYEANQSEKATQMGARYAIVTDVIPPELVAESYVGTSNCDEDNDGSYENCATGADVKNPAALGVLTCTNASCTCTTSPCPQGAAIPADSFTNLVNRMKAMKPGISAANVRIEFRGSGIGFAGDPTGMDVVPLVTVRLANQQFRPIALLGAVPFNLRSYATTLSAEDSAGVLAN
jgi:hypothetical protein